MRSRDTGSCLRQVVLIATVALTTLFMVVQARATTLDDLVSSVVRVKTFIDPDGTWVANLGKEREGSGIVIDESGLVLTIGYLMVEAHAAEIVTNSRPDLAGERRRLRPRDRIWTAANARAAEDQAARLRPLGGSQGTGPGAWW